jgi:hypothetical protein
MYVALGSVKVKALAAVAPNPSIEADAAAERDANVVESE